MRKKEFKIPEYELESLARCALEAIEAYYTSDNKNNINNSNSKDICNEKQKIRR